MAKSEDFERAYSAIKPLVAQFTENEQHFLSSAYQEAHLRKDFLDKFFRILGWDVDHEREADPWRQEVKIERSDRKAKGRADYSFSLAPHFRRVRFFAEAKRPNVNIATPDNCFQTIRYSWPKGVPIALLTDFRSLHVVDSRYKPNIKTAASRIVRSWHYTDYADRNKFAEIYWLFSREAVFGLSIENFAENELPATDKAVEKYTLVPRETREFDDDFLQTLDDWREELASSFKSVRSELTGEQLTECVQRTLDRLLFIRFLEDKYIEQDHIIAKFGERNHSKWADFITACEKLDRTYNGIVFKRHPILDDHRFALTSPIFGAICDELSDPHSPYNFDSIPVEILGRIYERFLGKIVLLKGRGVRVEEKPAVRKAGGVYYTPDYIVAYMVEEALAPQIRRKHPDTILKVKIIDTACGSGSFLIGAFAYLVQAIAHYWRTYRGEAKKGLIDIRDGEMWLTLMYRCQILVNCIHGIDIDAQAVEVAQLSLYLKLLEDETTHSAQQQQMEIGAALLPSLAANIVVGNSLITAAGKNGDLFSVDEQDEFKVIDFKKTFEQPFKAGGFDLVIGNPPYIKEYTNSDAFANVTTSPYYEGKMDIWYMFACLGLDWLKPKTGTLAYIATNNWVTAGGAKLLRAKIAKDARIEHLIDFGDYKVFRDAGIQTMILIARRDGNPAKYKFDYRRLTGSKRSFEDAQALLDRVANPFCEYLEPTFSRNRVPGTPFTFSGGDIEELLDFMASKKNFSLQEDEVGVGIDVHQDFVNAAAANKSRGRLTTGEGVFNLSHAEKRALGLTAAERDMVKPFYTTEELGPYYGSDTNHLWVIYTDSRFSDPKEMKPYPNLKSHLDKFKSIITSDNHPYGLHRARDERFFLGEKIISLRKCLRPTFTYTDFPCYVSQTFNVIKTERVSLLYLTGLLNSRLVRFWLKHRGKMQGHHFQIDKEPLLAVPLFVPPANAQKRAAKIVSNIIAAKKKMAGKTVTQAQRTRLETLCEQLEQSLNAEVENLYGLSAEQQALFDGN